ncbi:MAG: amidohydrolase family protein [Treponema sp.]|jgi:hypothetical protein|nr:amidohydrolase family protein [Treponema sp.]
MPPNEEYIFRFTEDITLRIGRDMPITDAHMHIQSNDIAPIPIMQGLVNYKISEALHKAAGTDKELEKKMNFVNLSYLPSDNTARINQIAPIKNGGPFLCDFANSEKIEISLSNAVRELPTPTGLLAEAVGVGIICLALGIQFNPLTQPLPLVVAMEIEKRINPPDNERRRTLTDLTASFWMRRSLKDYGVIARQNSFFIAGMYKDDPILKSEMGSNSRARGLAIYDSNDVSESGKKRVELVNDRRQESYFKVVTDHYYNRHSQICRYRRVYLVPSFSMSIIHGMELMYAHYWGVYGIPVYIEYDQKVYYITDNVINPQNRNDRWHNIYDTQTGYIGIFKQFLVDPYIKTFTLKDSPILENDKLGENNVKYTHFLKRVPDTEKFQFEDLTKHIEYTKAATARYPLEYLPFYHVDPRRFFAPVEVLGKYHDFFICSNNNFRWINGSEIQRSITDGNKTFKYRMDFNQEVKQNLIYKNGGGWTKGLFWGIKMYAALGYPPYLGVNNNSEAKKVFNCLGKEDYKDAYKGLLEMYNFCAESEVPITCHGSPRGMTIADPGTYLKEFLKDNPGTGYVTISKNDFPVDGKSFMYGIGLVDSFSSPESWRVVLNALNPDNKQKLKLCLAHFGGKKFFSGEVDLFSPYDWLNDIARLADDFNGVYTDISCFVYDKFVPMPKSIPSSLYNKIKNKLPNNLIASIYDYGTRYCKYNPDPFIDAINLALLRLYIILEYPNYKGDLEEYEGIYNTAQNLASKIRYKNVLQHRILFGTDWPMSEMDVKGVLRYSGAIFVMLQLVTVFLDNEWDAWHQFAVINPLRFLGLLENPDDNIDVYKLKIDKITKMKEAIEAHLNIIESNDKEKDKYKKHYDIDPNNKEKLNKRYQYMESIAGQDILSAKYIVDEDNRLLLTNMVKGSKVS